VDHPFCSTFQLLNRPFLTRQRRFVSWPLLRRLGVLVTCLIFSFGVLKASDRIEEPLGGRSNLVKQPHVTAELIAASHWVAGRPIEAVLHLHMDPDWHTYWINPGDAGLATTITWTLSPDIVSAGPVQWPTPEKHAMGPLTTYGYGGDVYLLTTLQTSPHAVGNLSRKIDLKAHVEWLVCQEECIPGHADLTLPLESEGAGTASAAGSEPFLRAVGSRLPLTNAWWEISSSYQGRRLELRFKGKPGAPQMPSGDLSFFVEQPNVLETKSNQLVIDSHDPATGDWVGHLDLIQNGEKPEVLSGVLVANQPIVGNEGDNPLMGDSKAVYFSNFTAGTSPSGKAGERGSSLVAALPSHAPTPSLVTKSPEVASAPFLPAILGAAFLGGLILNLMPCVLPVLSLKVLSLIRHSSGGSREAWKQGLAFTVGVLVSFWILAGLLIALESAGSHLGWGFQMQSPFFVLALVFLFFLLGLNLFGVFELGTSLVGLDAKATNSLGGLASSFANGALATAAATPCTAPFMGSAVGYAAQQPAIVSLLVFTALALGMSAPYLALTIIPGAMRLVPKPGAWMETLRQFMGFLLMATVIFLVYVFGALTGQDSVPVLLAALLLAAVAVWIYGRYAMPIRGFRTRTVATVASVLLLGLAIAGGVRLAYQTPLPGEAASDSTWKAWSPEKVQKALAQGRPVFVDFTAAWCLSCKVNERVALDIESTKTIFAQKQVALFRGDWTKSDPLISESLRKFNRDGVPLYLLYSPQAPDAPQLLPEVLTPGIVQKAIQKLP
jgi:thiol:disulfide interchange protein/DsbC/DsbD-like thiol-disulfide interchange protein